MTTFMIAYDLASQDAQPLLAATIMSLGEAWARPLEHTWYVRVADADAEDMERALAGFLCDDDGLIVQALSTDAAMTNTNLRWFRRRRTGHLNPAADGAEIVNFQPRAAATPCGSDELVAELAQAC